MIVSHKFKFIFIKTTKTAGTSIEIFLSACCSQDDIVTPIIPYVEPHHPRNYEGYYNHIPGHVVRSQVGTDVWNSYYKFCVERNPWDKVLSHFHMVRAREDNTLTFERYLDKKSFPSDFQKYTEPSNSDSIILDEVLRYEQLSVDLTRTFTRLGIPFNGDLGARAKSEYRTDRRCYRDVYSSTQADLVRRAFAKEIALHGYSF